jgi:hypothetical protein
MKENAMVRTIRKAKQGACKVALVMEMLRGQQPNNITL